MSSAFGDNRFEPLSLEEVPDLECEVSLLHTFETAKNALDWEVGKHGIMIDFEVDDEEGTFVLPVGADFREFLSHLLYCKGTSPLAQIFRLDEARFQKLLRDNAANTWPGCEEDFKRRDVSLAAVAETFGIQPRDPFQRVKALQAIFDPSVLVFSDEYYDTLGLEHPSRPEDRDIITGRDVAVTQMIFTKREDTP